MILLRGLVFAYIVIFFGAAFWAKMLKKKIGQIMPFYLMSSAIVAYLFGVLGQLKAGYIVVTAISLLGELVLIASYAAKKNLKKLAKEQLDMSFVICSVFYLIIAMLNFGRGINHWDDYMHWGPFAKETYRLMDFYASSAAITIHKDYPPIITIYQVLWQFLAGGFNESLLFVATEFFGLSMFMPFANKIKAKDVAERPLATLAVISAILLVPIVSQSDDAGFYHTLYMDFMMALLFAFSLAIIRKEERFGLKFWIKLMLIFSFLFLIKQIGAFFVVCAMIYAAIRILQNKKYPSLLVLISTTFLPIVFLSFWKNIVAETGFVGQFSTSDFINRSIDLLLGGLFNLNEVDHEIATIFVSNAFFKQQFILGLSYGQIVIGLIIMVVFVIQKVKDRTKRRETLNILGLFIFTGLSYLLALFLMYLTIFGKAEALLNQSFVRYASVVWRALLVYLIMRSIDGVDLQKLSKVKYLSYAIIVALLVFSNPIALIKSAPMDSGAERYGDAVAMIERNTTTKDKVFVIDQEWSGSNLICLRYYLMPRITNIFDVDKHHVDQDYPDDFFPETRTATELRTDLESYQYLYISRIDDGFIERYGELFEQTPVDGGLYRLTEDKYILVEQVIIDND